MTDNSYDYDIVIIGAGIHGAGVAQAAVAWGYRVLVLEQAEVATGTSSRSSKLIHGGLRYLEQLQLGLVRECLQEREILLRIAPDLVKLRNFVIPVYHETSRRPWQLFAGLKIYDLLADSKNARRSGRLPRSQWSELAPLKTEGLQAVFRYQDAQTDDAMLTRAVMNSAQSLGARLCEHARFLSASQSDNGCELQYERDGHTERVFSRAVVNAAGPWAHSVAGQIAPLAAQPSTELMQGSHILISGLAIDYCYYLEAPQDRRAVFVTPWREFTLVGTTETPFVGMDPAAISPTQKEVDYLLEIVAYYFPASKISVNSVFAGLRVLPASRGSAFGRSRELIISHNTNQQSRVIHMYGGKLTSYRSDSERVLQQLTSVLPERKKAADTCHLPLYPP